MARFHFVEDYQALVKALLKRHSLDEAMSLAVGGHWEEMGHRCANLLISRGLSNGMRVLDFGCGSGRVAFALSKHIDLEDFVGIDVVDELTDYARSRCPDTYRFVISHSLEIPLVPESLDYAYALSVFTHLSQVEIAIYIEEIYRKLRSAGLFLFSFLEVNRHWELFESTKLSYRRHGKYYPHLNMFMDRTQVDWIAKNVGFEVVETIEPDDPDYSIGQTVVLMRKR